MTVVPMVCPVSWPLPAIEQDVARLKRRDRFGDGRGAVADLDGTGRRRQYLAPDRGRIFASWIVVGDDGEIGLCRRHRAHLGSLALVAVAAATEHHQQPVAHIRPQRVERLGQRIGRVGVVDEDGRAFVRRAGQIEAAASAMQF